MTDSIRHRSPVGPLLVAIATIGGCTIGDGEGFGRLSARLTGAFDGLDPARRRIQPDGWYRANNSFELQLATLTLAVREVALLGSAGGSGSPAQSTDDCAFDPANPPPGCTLCHGGHCHCGSELKDYAELEAEVCAGGSSGPAVVARFGAIEPLALLGPAGEQPLVDCSGATDPRLAQQQGPACELARGAIEQIRLLLDRLSVTATLRDPSIEDRLAGEQLQLQVDWDLAGAALTVDLPEAEPLDRDHDYQLDLTVALGVSDKLFDDVTWHQLQRQGALLLVNSAQNRAAAETITAHLAASVLQTTLHRSD
jgi:hypothetical protein